MIGAVVVPEFQVERVLHQVRSLLLQVFVRLHSVGVEHPLVERMSDAVSGGVGIEWSVGLLMVLAMYADPDDGRAHQGEITAGANDVFEPFGHDQRLVSQESVISKRNTDSMPVMPENCPGKNDQTGGQDRIVKDAQSEFLLLSFKMTFKA